MPVTPSTSALRSTAAPMAQPDTACGESSLDIAGDAALNAQGTGIARSGHDPLEVSAQAIDARPMPRSVTTTGVLLFSYAILITGNGLLGTVISLRMIQQHAATLIVGVVQSSYYIGLMVGALWSGGLINRIGHHRSFVAFAAIAACCALGYPVYDEWWIWVGLRGIMGVCLVGIFTVMESWLHGIATNSLRGRIFSSYLITNYLSVGIGQFLIGLADPGGFVLFSLVSALFSASLVPVALSGHAPAKPVGPDSRLSRGFSGVLTVWRVAPIGIGGCFAAGLLYSAFYTMQPVFMRKLDYSLTEVAHFMGFALLAALLPQWPIARLADLLERRLIVVASTASMTVCSLMLFGLSHGEHRVAIEAINFAYVAITFTLYGVMASYVNDLVPANARIAVSAGLLLVFSAGASMGPTLASMAMWAAGPGGLYLFTAAVSAAMSATNLRSRRKGHKERKAGNEIAGTEWPVGADLISSGGLPADVVNSPKGAAARRSEAGI